MGTGDGGGVVSGEAVVLILGRRVLLQQHRTQPGTLEYNFGHIRIRRLGDSRCVWTAQNVEPKATTGRPKPQDGGVVNVVMNGPTRRAACQTSLRQKFRCHHSFPQPSNANPVSYVTGTSGPMPTSKLQPLSQQGFWYLSSRLLA